VPADFHSFASAAFSAAWASNCCRPLFFVFANPLMALHAWALIVVDFDIAYA
jgi:hypothetical protein